ncbi:MAG: DUF4956 domain-containing protein [Anaerolineae bacterium]|nr:DUF4956 domain-containing protein [Anaerolineae bacterium]
MNNFDDFLYGFGLNLLTALVIVRVIYYPTNRNKTYIFSFLALNTVLFFVLSFLTSIELGVGVGFGLFAIFSIMRYRTDSIPIREMTYMFILAALPVLNIAGSKVEAWRYLVVADLAIVLVLALLEAGWGFRFEYSQSIVYEGAALAHPARRDELLADLRKRTGLEVTRVAIGKLDYVKDTVRLQVYYDAPRGAEGKKFVPFVLATDNGDD